jgi:hypothetical protein
MCLGLGIIGGAIGLLCVLPLVVILDRTLANP